MDAQTILDQLSVDNLRAKLDDLECERKATLTLYRAALRREGCGTRQGRRQQGQPATGKAVAK